MKYYWIGWCHKDNHDKVWGIIKLQGGENFLSKMKFITFWGRRGKKLQTKICEDWSDDVDRLIDKKADKGYTKIDTNKLDRVYPEFERDLEKTACWSMLTL